MASINAEDLDPINNNTMSNNNNSSNVNNNNTAVLTSIVIPGSCNDANAPCNGGGDDGNAAATSASVPVVSTVDTNSSTSNSRSRSSSSRRSRSGGRSRSRRRHSQSSGRRSRHHSRGSHKRRERNFPSALCNMISIVIMCTALAEPSWIRIDNGHCTQLASTSNGGPPYGLENLRYLGALQFFYLGEMVINDPNVDHKEINVITEYRSGPEDSDRLINCVTERVVIVFKIIIALTFLAILTSLFSFSLDLVGFDQRLFRIFRQSAIFNIFTVVVCVGITTLLYWATVDVLDLQLNSKIPNNDNVRVLFDVSFYLITAAGACSVISVACNCLQRKISDMTSSSTPGAWNILDNQFSDGTENLLSIGSTSSFHHGQDYSSPMTNLPPPPPYTP